MTDAIVKVMKGGRSLAGRPSANTGRALNLARRRYAARWIKTTRNLFDYLDATLTAARSGGLPLDATWAKLYSDLSDRVGPRRGYEQKTDMTSISANLGSVEDIARQLLSEVLADER